MNEFEYAKVNSFHFNFCPFSFSDVTDTTSFFGGTWNQNVNV